MRFGCIVATSLLVASVTFAQDVPPGGAGPRGTSGEVHDDSVGIATLLTATPGAAAAVRVAVLHPTLPDGSFVEVTALDSGRTIVALVVGPYRGRGIVGLSPDAAQALGIADGAGVRVRAVTPSPQDQAALRSGQAASGRIDAPPALLVALRHKLPNGAAPRAATTRVAHAPVPRAPAPRDPVAERQSAPIPGRAGSYGVQVAAMSAADRAAALARTIGGHVVTGGGIYRVQLGPFANAAAATRARDAVARQGYRDARIFHSE